MDTLLTLAEERVITWVWTDELLGEWERVIVGENQRSAESAASVARVIRQFFARGRLQPEKYLPLVDESLSPDPDDRVHAAACLGGDIDAFLTRNTKDFPLDRLREAGVAAQSADDFLVSMFERRRSSVTSAVELTAARKQNPPKSRCDLVADLRRAGSPRFAGVLAKAFGCTPP